MAASNAFTVNSPINGAGRGSKGVWAPLLERGHSELPEAFYGMKIGPFLTEIWPKMPIFGQAIPQKLERAPLLGEAPLWENLRNVRPM